MNSDNDIANALIRHLSVRGYFAKHRNIKEWPHSVICARSEPNGWDSCFSFWVTKPSQHWHLCCWSYRYWRVPQYSRIDEVCLNYLNYGHNIASPPDFLLTQFDLLEIDYDEFKSLRLDRRL